jgi:hypothetical protein
VNGGAEKENDLELPEKAGMGDNPIKLTSPSIRVTISFASSPSFSFRRLRQWVK